MKWLVSAFAILLLAAVVLLLGACLNDGEYGFNILLGQMPEGVDVIESPPDTFQPPGQGLTELGMRLSAMILETDLTAVELLEHYSVALKQEDWHESARGWCDASQAQRFGCNEGATIAWSGPEFDIGPGVAVAYLSIRPLDGQQWLVRYWEAIGGEIPSDEQGGDEGDSTPPSPPPIGDEGPQPGGIIDIPESVFPKLQKAPS